MDVDRDVDTWSLDQEAELRRKIKLCRFACFDARFGRKGNMAVIEGACDKCKKKTRVLAIDCSEGEYAPGAVCMACIKKAFY